MSKSTKQFEPDYAVHPGEILEETLQAREIKKSEFARRCQMSTKTISQIIHGKAVVTPETAIQFERVLGVSASIWTNLDSNYRLYMAKQESRQDLEEQQAWPNKFPLKKLITLGAIPKDVTATPIEKLLAFFGVGSVEGWNESYGKMAVNFRRSPSFKSSIESVSAWLRLCELNAERVDTEPYTKENFLEAVNEIRALTNTEPETFVPKMRELCSNAGVVIVFQSELPNTHLSGATRWLTKDKALIMLSLRHKRDDHFWFTFFHEAAHILMHGKKQIFVDEKDAETNEEERQADLFSCNLLIPEDEYIEFTEERLLFSRQAVLTFAKRVGVAPGIVVGRLQHDGIIPYRNLNKLKRKFILKESQEDTY